MFKRILGSLLAVAMMASVSSTVMAGEENGDAYITYDIEKGQSVAWSATRNAMATTPMLPTASLGDTVPDTEGLSFEVATEDDFNQIDMFAYTTPWTKVTNPQVWPYCAIARLEIRYGTGSSAYTEYATGVMVGSGKILTAAHCVYKMNGDKATSIVAKFGKNGTSSSGVVSVSASASSYSYSSSWPSSMIADNDYAVINVSTNANQYTGNFGLTVDANTSTNYTLSGYPYVTGYKSEYMYTDSGTLTTSPSTNTISHPFNSAASMSGSPIYTSGQLIVGIHTWGNNDTTYSGGTATRVTQSVINLVV